MSARDQLSLVETATVGHFRTDGFLPPSIQCVREDVRVCGRALTVSLPGDDGAALSHALSMARPGDVVVVARPEGGDHACWGAVMTEAAVAAGVSGVVIDGYVTDIGAIRKSGLALWCRGRSPLTTKVRGSGTVGFPITIGRVTIRRGDLVLADENGVCVLDPADADGVAATALEMQRVEPEIIERLRRGETLVDINAVPPVRIAPLRGPDGGDA